MITPTMCVTSSVMQVNGNTLLNPAINKLNWQIEKKHGVSVFPVGTMIKYKKSLLIPKHEFLFFVSEILFQLVCYNYYNIPPASATWPDLKDTAQFERAASAIMGGRPHTISAGTVLMYFYGTEIL